MGVYTSDVTIDVNGNSVQVTNFPATQPVSGTVTDNQGAPNTLANAWPIEVTDGTNILGTSAHPLNTVSAVSATATVTQVVLANNTNGTLLASNASRKSAIIFCPSSTLQVKYGAVASLTSFTWKVTTNNTTITVVGYTGQIDAFGMGQTVTVTELV